MIVGKVTFTISKTPKLLINFKTFYFENLNSKFLIIKNSILIKV